MSQNILITGGAGFIGSHLVDICINNGHKVLVYDNFTVGKKEFLPGRPSLSIVEGDILDNVLLAQTVDSFKPDVVFHLAAIHFIPACENDPVMALKINVEGTQNVLSVCRNKVNQVVFASTGAIYDPGVNTVLSENSPIATKDIYGLTKHTAERLIEYHINKGFGNVVVARLFNAVGRRETNPHLIPAIMEQLGNGVRVVELGNLYPRRDYIHVEDIAEALYALKDVSVADMPLIFNIGSGMEYSVQELVDTCAKVINDDIKIESVAERMRKIDRPSQLAGIDYIQSTTGWLPKRSLKQAVEEIWQEITQLQQLNVE